MDYIPDYTDMFNEYEAAQENRLRERPKCDCCREPIMEDYFFKINGEFVCETCLNEDYREDTEDYMED